MKLNSFLLCCAVFCLTNAKSEKLSKKKNAAVTFVMGEYFYGALALGQSLVDVGSDLTRVAIVTADMPSGQRKALSHFWKIYEHDPIYCKIIDKSKMNDIQRYMEAPSTKTWLPTCTKFVAWKLIEYDRIVFFDSDTLVVQPIDHVVSAYSNASFLAAPEIFPPDTFNSGLMVFTPSLETFDHLLYLLEHVGSNDGGDQGVLNMGLCPNWYTADSTDTKCGRLPWRYNVEYHLFTLHHIYTSTTGQPLPAVLHFIGLKPWHILAADYAGKLDPSLAARLEELADAHILWRDALIRACDVIGEPLGYSTQSVLYGKDLSPRASIDYHLGGHAKIASIDASEQSGESSIEGEIASVYVSRDSSEMGDSGQGAGHAPRRTGRVRQPVEGKMKKGKRNKQLKQHFIIEEGEVGEDAGERIRESLDKKRLKRRHTRAADS